MLHFIVGSLLVMQSYGAWSQSAQNRIRPYLILNQSKYIPGDTIWFKAYLLQENLTCASGKYRLHINLVDNQGNPEFNSLVAVTDGIGQNQLPLPESIEPGLHLLTAYLDGQHDGQTFIFKKEVLLVSSEFQITHPPHAEIEPGKKTIDVSIEVSQPEFRPREKMSMQVLLRDENGNPVAGEFSVSVVNKELFTDQNADLFCQELLTLFNDLDKGTQSHIKAASNQQRLAQVFFNDSEEYLPDSTVVYFYLQRSRWRYQTIVGKNGWVRLSLPDLSHQDEFFYLADIKGQITENIKVKWEKHNIVLPRARTPERSEGVDKYALFASKKKIIDQSFGFYARANTKIVEGNEERNDFLPISITIDTRDYDVFPTMQEYIKEIVPALYYRSRGGKDIIRVKLQTPGSSHPPATALQDPIYLIDEVATQNTSFFLSLKPAEIQTIKIANDPRKLAPWGLFGKNGIVLVQTKQGNLRVPLNDQTKIFDGLSPGIPVRTNVQENAVHSRVPDFRANLYWNPTVATGPNGRAVVDFLGSDDVGEFEIRIHGITGSGQPFSAQRSITIKH